MSLEGNMGFRPDMGDMVKLACTSAGYAHCPDSGRRIGVCVQGENGECYTGCTFDSVAYPSSLCAAHVAVSRAATEGRTKVLACVVVELLNGDLRANVNDSGKRFPLGGCCLQYIWDYATGGDAKISTVCIDATKRDAPKRVETFHLSELLPKGSVLPSPFPSTNFSFNVKRLSGSHDRVVIELIKAAGEAARGSCCWLSDISVGCAILTDKGIICGANSESSHLGIGCCAEVTAVGKAIALGCTEFKMVAIVIPSMPDVFGSPCGRCSQILWEAQHLTRTAHGAGRQLIVVRCRLDPSVPFKVAVAEGLWEASVKAIGDMGPADQFTP